MCIIKNEDVIRRIKANNEHFDLTSLSDKTIEGLSEIFYRYKPIFPALKNKNNSHIINRISRMAKKNHQPLRPSIWDTMLTEKIDLTKDLREPDSIFRVVRILNAIREKFIDYSGVVYPVRNGTAWVKDNHTEYDKEYLLGLYDKLLNMLVEHISRNKCVVRFPKNYTISCPTSEKNFIGNIPFGTSYELTDNNFFGIYWKGEWGTDDFDLSFIDQQSHTKIGWDDEYNSMGVTYSGDMTYADPEAAEILYCRKGCPDGSIYVNRYWGKEGSKFRLWFGRGENETEMLDKPYMINPQCIELEDDIVSDKLQKLVGIISNNRAYLTSMAIDQNRVSGKCNIDYFSAIRKRVIACIPLKEVLLKAGFTEHDENNKDEQFVDLTSCSRDTILTLFA